MKGRNGAVEAEVARNKSCAWKVVSETRTGGNVRKNSPKRSHWLGILHQCKRIHLTSDFIATKNLILLAALRAMIFTLLLSCGGMFIHCLIDKESWKFQRLTFKLLLHHDAHSVCWKWYCLPLHRQWSYWKDRILYSCSHPWSHISYRYVISIFQDPSLI